MEKSVYKQIISGKRPACMYVLVGMPLCVCVCVCVCACRIIWLQRKIWKHIHEFLNLAYLEHGLPLWLGWWRIPLQFGRPGFDPWVGKIPWRRERLPTPVFWPGEIHGLYSPCGCKESDMTEWLLLHYLGHIENVYRDM